MYKKYLFAIVLVMICAAFTFAQKNNEKKDTLGADITGALKWRSIGPALTSGRIADFAVNPKNTSEYYVAVASGHIWKTTNAGTTFEPVFDNYGSYSIGCLAIDPNNPYVVWAGTGENNHQRSLGYGDGVYRTSDGGKSWTNMGLKNSRQIGKIIIDPRNSNIIFVAAEGSVWGPGGDRGLYKSTDGGKNWKKTLNISENTGVNNIAYDFRNPDIMYATSEQRRRHVFTKIGGGPESAVYRSTDAGETWEKIMNGLPSVDIGGTGIAVSPVNPDVVYLIVEAAEKQGGFYRSTNRGASWDKMSDHTEAGQYYNEIVCDPKDVNKVFSTETRSAYTLDGGKTWTLISNNGRHVDDHALWIDPDDTKHYLIGGDGGVYETFDFGETFEFKANLPVTQFYRVNVDNDYPFYNVYGGTQDNNSLGGPSRTKYNNGIENSDWYVTNGGDGFWTAIDPHDPNTVYAESQYAGMVRFDRATGEMLSIRPEPRKGENTYRWNWNTPLFISPHKNTRLYCAANKVFRSEDRGDTWEVISEDLTAQIDRNSFKVMDKYWSYDATAKDRSTSLYGCIISLAESPMKEGLLYAGTDDGLMQVYDGGSWKKIASFPGVPENTYVSDICPSKFDENIVFASFDNILRDDFKPYILKSTDKGKSWKSIASNLPEGTIHTIEQDFINPDLLFVGTEFGVYCTTDGGEKWFALKSGLPTIQVRDIAIQKRENDLVIATFGRGFYVLDNYSCLQNINKELLDKDAFIFPVKDGMEYIPAWRGGALGSSFFSSPNPEFGVTINFYVKDVPKTLKQVRREKEKELFKSGSPIPQPTQAELIEEDREVDPYFLITITDAANNVVRKLTKSAGKGIQRVVWDMKYGDFSPVPSKQKFAPTDKPRSGYFAIPGSYNVQIQVVSREGVKDLAGAVPFKIDVLRSNTLPDSDKKALAEFQVKAAELARKVYSAQSFLNNTINLVENIKQAILNTSKANPQLLVKADSIGRRLDDIYLKFQRRSSRPSAEENPPAPVPLMDRLDVMTYNHVQSSSKLTKTEQTAHEILNEEFTPVHNELMRLYNDEIKPLEKILDDLGVPYYQGKTLEN